MRGGLLHRGVDAVRATILLSAAAIAVQVAIAAILGRALSPTEFGLFALPSTFASLILHLSQRGVASALVREPSVTDELVGAVFHLSLALGLASAAAVLLAGKVYVLTAPGADGATVLRLFSWVSVAAFLGTLTGVPVALLQRQLRFAQIGVAQLAGLVVGNGAVAMGMASAGHGSISLAAGFAASYAVNLFVLCYVARRDLRWRPRLGFRHLGAFAAYGLRLTMLRVVDYVWVQLPLLFGGYTVSPAALGLYSRAQYVADFALQTTIWRVTAVLFPVVAGLAHERSRLASLVPLLTAAYALVVLPGCAWIAVFPDFVLTVLLGAQWAEGGAVLAILTFAFGAWTLNHPSGCVLEALGWLRSRFLAGILAPFVFLLIAAVLHGRGASGLATAALGSSLVPLALNGMFLWRRLEIGGLAEMAVAMIPGSLVALVVAATGAAVRGLAEGAGLHPAVILLSGALTAAAVYIPVVRLVLPETLRNAIRAAVPAELNGLPGALQRLLDLRPVRPAEVAP